MQTTNQRQLGGENTDWLNHADDAIGECLSLWGLTERAEARAQDPAYSPGERRRAALERDELQEALRLRLLDVTHDIEGARQVLSLETLRESRQWPKTERTAGGLRAMARLSLFAQDLAAGQGESRALSGQAPSAA